MPFENYVSLVVRELVHRVQALCRVGDTVPTEVIHERSKRVRQFEFSNSHPTDRIGRTESSGW
jgi:hypothetical protein